MRITVLCICLVLYSRWLPAAPELYPYAASKTLREALTNLGFSEAISSPDVPELDRPLTSSTHAISDGTFAAAYYFADESSGGVSLGPLHVSRYDRQGHRWIHAPKLSNVTAGSALQMQITKHHLLLELHINPSAGQGLILDVATLRVIKSLAGFGFRELPNGSVLYSDNMVHFAPVHQQRLFLYTPVTENEIELFPGEAVSILAEQFRQDVQGAYARLPESMKEPYENSAYGTVDDFDRSLGHIAIRDDGARIALVATYSSARLPEEVTPPVVQTVVQCDQPADGWACNENILQQSASRAGIALTCNKGMCGSEADINQLLHAVLNAP